ncbi:hypothetical protein CSHISOI_06654 [Colletotrichum shisoi]|uniref:Uncharacterized protein n=1 Tax=Colletotrichum shisoi TaxID=2078593 RepID=A0A5Q4BPB1_9PEZI|nr:hypothetical protein CSHISOI_06654 [Colletotrichum shisoi]
MAEIPSNAHSDMDHKGPPDLITTKNSAARFVYGTVGGTSSVSRGDLVFVDDFDAFVPRDQVPDRTKCFVKSQKHMQLFQDTLKKFIQNMETRQVLRRLGVDLQDPARCDLEYVFDIAKIAVEKRDGTGNLRACKAFARSCLKNANRRDTALGAIMSMIPGDIYGSVLSGGVLTILALAMVQRLSDVHVKSELLHERADGVLVAIFVVLEEIVNDLTMDWKAKMVSKMKFGDEDRISNALSSLDESLSEFEAELNICTQHRFGRMHEAIIAQGENIQKILDMANAFAANLSEKTSDTAVQQFLEKQFLNALTISCASDSNFNTIDGGRNLQDGEGGDGPVNDTSDVLQKNKQIVDQWLESIGEFDPSSETHVKECIRAGLGQLRPDDREKSEWIMSSDESRNWMRLDKSNVLSIRAEEAPDGLFHPFSFTAALVSEILQKSTGYPVLSFFCGLRTNGAVDGMIGGPNAVLKSLNGQLLQFCLRERPGVDLSSLDQPKRKLMKKSKKKVEHGMRLFRGLLESLEDKDAVYVILDSWSRLLGSREEADSVIMGLCQTVKDLPHLVIKLLVLDALPLDPVHELAHSLLYVPEEIDGWKNDVQLSQLEQSNLDLVKELEETRRRESEDLAESDSEDSDDNR